MVTKNTKNYQQIKTPVKMFVPYGAWFQPAWQIGFDKMNM